MVEDGAVLITKFDDIPRSATRRSAEHGNESRSLSAWSDLGAFVLLAEPGGGKSRAFAFEARASGGVCVKARTFANVGPPGEWSGETLFIDGLDEMRADTAARAGPLDAVIQRLNELGCPRFRLSCREADWLAAVDHEALREVAPGKELDVLHLDPLNDVEVTELLRRRSDRVPDPERFRQQAKTRGLDEMLRSPLLLELLVDAVGDDWPRGRADVYRLACDRMATEHNEIIRVARVVAAPTVEQTLEDAGLLCAVLLLAGLDALVDGIVADASTDASIYTLPSALGLTDARATLSSKLFIVEGQRRFPRHRSVAEYLAAGAIGHRVTHGGLPITRVLALMSSFDGGVVEPLRGLNAWLAVHCSQYRTILIDRDPLACVLYGDVHTFGSEDKRRVLDGLRREAERFVWFRKGNWVAHPFGALGTADMTSEFAVLLSSPDRDPVHQSLLDCALDAIRYGETMPRLLPLLESVIRDATYQDDLRTAALDAWLEHVGPTKAHARVWLDEIRDGNLCDPSDQLCGRLLDALYPEVVTPAEVMRYFHIAKAENFVGNYRLFWSTYMLDRTVESARPLLADALASQGITGDVLHDRYDFPRILSRVISVALEALGSEVEITRVAKWLSVGIDENGFCALNGDEADGIRDWLEQNPSVQKGLIAHRYALPAPGQQSARSYFWSCEEILYRARRPRDWYRWLLTHATQIESEPLVEHCVTSAAHAVLRQLEDFDITIDDVAVWLQVNSDRWPQAVRWIEEAWSLPIDHWLGREHRRGRDSAIELSAMRERRMADYAWHLVGIESGTAVPHAMANVALAYRGSFTDVRGDTPQERVRELLVCDENGAKRAIAGLEATLRRTDLPSVEEIFEADFDQRPHYIRPACLLAAELVQARSANAVLEWDDDLVKKLVAFHLTDGSGNGADWYGVLAQYRHHVVAEVLGAYAQRCLMQRPEQSITGLWSLAREETQAELARIVTGPLLRSFPIRARPAQLRRLSTELLPAAMRHLQEDELKGIVRDRLSEENLDSGQRMAWLVAGMRFAAHQRSRCLVKLVSKSRVRSMRLGAILNMHADGAIHLPRLPSAALSRLIQLLAPHASPEYPVGAGWIGPRDYLRDTVRGLIQQIGALDDEQVPQEIQRMRELPALAAWKTALDASLFDHVRAMRSARFSHASSDAIAQALSGQAPANVLDLAALAMQHLQVLQDRLRGDETNSLRQFWRDPDSNGWRPRTENECRDLLLDKLRDRLDRQCVSIHKEAAHANDTRADLRVEAIAMGQRRVVPIEIKKENHPHVWTAWRSQLEQRYMTDPAAEGVGIYLVLWFGSQPRADETGVVPASAQEFAERLTLLVPRADRVRLQICVLDLSMATFVRRANVRRPLGRAAKHATKTIAKS